VVAGQNVLQLRQKYGEIGGAFVWRYTTDRAKIAQWATVLHGTLAQQS
jgi:hypothetical protein